MATNTDGNAENAKFLEQLVKLTDAVQRLAQNSLTAERDEGVLLRQRVDFGYQALGTLMGRARTKGFNVRVVDARWDKSGTAVELFNLPAEAAWAELRGGVTTELLEIDRPQYDGDTAADAKPQSKRRQPPDKTPDGRVQPAELTSDDRIDSLLVLRVRRGPPIAIGPRVEPLQVSRYS